MMCTPIIVPPPPTRTIVASLEFFTGGSPRLLSGDMDGLYYKAKLNSSSLGRRIISLIKLGSMAGGEVTSHHLTNKLFEHKFYKIALATVK